jgi:hypothetical protein
MFAHHPAGVFEDGVDGPRLDDVHDRDRRVRHFDIADILHDVASRAVQAGADGGHRHLSAADAWMKDQRYRDYVSLPT